MRIAFYIFLIIVLISCSSHETPTTLKESTQSEIIAQPTSISSVNESWLGEWERHQWQNDATLNVSDIKGDSIVFSLQAVSGGHTSEVEGSAVVRGDIATFSGSENDHSCFIEFKLLGDSIITISQKKGDCFAAVGVSYSGDYKSAKSLPPTEKSETLVDLGIFKTEKEDSVFRSLAGDSYSLFVNSTQLTSEEDDLDSLHATVRSSAVRGLYTVMENIIMTDPSNNIWAAVIDDDKVYYFTNTEEYKNRLPKTIENWRERFKEHEVIYK